MLVGLSRYFNFAWIASCNFRSLRSCWKGEVSKLPVALGRRSTQCFHVVGNVQPVMDASPLDIPLFVN